MADAEEFLIIKGTRILLPDCISSGSIIAKNGKIVGIERGLDTTSLPSKAKVSFAYGTSRDIEKFWYRNEDLAAIFYFSIFSAPTIAFLAL